MPPTSLLSWLMAETVAFPLVSSAAYQRATTEFGRAHIGRMDPATRELAHALVQWLRPRASGASLRDLAAMRRMLWFHREETHAFLERYVVRTARERLRCAGGVVWLHTEPGSDLGHDRAVDRWHWLCRAMPVDLLVAACAHERDEPPPTDRVTLVETALGRVLEREVAESHLHVGAALSFPLLWTGLMVRGQELAPRDARLDRGGALPFGSNRAYLARMLAASVARMTVAAFLAWRRDTRAAGDIRAFWSQGAARLMERASWPGGVHQMEREWTRVLGLLLDAGRSLEWARVRALEGGVRAVFATARGPVASREVARQDPVAWLLRVRPGGALPETHLMHAALRYLLGPGRGDGAFRRLFWQYQRVRNMSFRHLTHEPGTSGLDWFARRYQRISALRAPLGGHKYALGLDHQAQDIGLQSFEARTSPEPTWYENWREVRALAEQARDWQTRRDGRVCEVGLVLHFVKSSHCQCGRLHTDPRHMAFGARCGVWFARARKQATAVARMLEHAPETLLVLRGLDVANAELALPTWVTVPLFHQLFAAAERARAELLRRRPGLGACARFARPLHATYHAGEEYPCVSEGLRRIHELVEARILREGDRIGHGLVLGADIDREAWASPVAVQAAEERLDDLLWEWDRYAAPDQGPEPPPGRGPRLQREIHELSREIYGPAMGGDVPPIVVLAEARRWRHRPDALARLGYPDAREPASNDPTLRVLWLYLTDPGVFQRGQRMRQVDVGSQSTRRSLCGLRDWLVARLSSMSISVESNPTSNQSIHHIPEIARHPSFVMQALAPSDEGPSSRPGLAVSINTDNPLTFATCLGDEYAYLHAALRRRHDVEGAQALDWLERARRAGWDARFTLPISARTACLDAIVHALD